MTLHEAFDSGRLKITVNFGVGGTPFSVTTHITVAEVSFGNQVIKVSTGPQGIAGPPGADGPPGPPGPMGGSGLVVVVNGTSTIPLGQIFTVVNGSGPTNQTLPPISSALVSGIATAYTITNYNSQTVTVLPNGSDLIMGDSSALMRGVSSLTFLPTSLGWLII